MSIVRITSWNAQGDAINKISQNYGSILPNKTSGFTQTEIDNIILIQEAGATYGRQIPLKGNIAQTYGRTDYKGYFSQQEDADNKRCTTGIMASKNSIDAYYMQIFDINPYDVKRPVVIALAQFKYYSLYIVTVHATANSHVSCGEIIAIVEKLKTLAKDLDWQFLLMGDFNIPPSELIKSGEIPAQNVIYTGKPTQKSGNELDYAIVSDKLIPRVKINHGTNCGSDHWPIYIELDPNVSL